MGVLRLDVMYCSPFVKFGLSWDYEELHPSLRLMVTPFPNNFTGLSLT